MGDERRHANPGWIPSLHALLQALRQLPEFQESAAEGDGPEAETLPTTVLGSVFRCLECQGYVKHLPHRRSSPRLPAAASGNHHGPAPCRLALTEAGEAFVRRLQEYLNVAGWTVSSEATGAVDGQAASPRVARERVPCFNTERRELRVSQQTIARFKRSARNQTAILTAFELEGWPSRIDDPLPWLKDALPWQRLHITVYRLNRHQQPQMIRFFCDGTGDGICWEYTALAPTDLLLFWKEV